MPDPHAQDATRADAMARLTERQQKCEADAWTLENDGDLDEGSDVANLITDCLDALSEAVRLLAAQPPGAGEPGEIAGVPEEMRRLVVQAYMGKRCPMCGGSAVGANGFNSYFWCRTCHHRWCIPWGIEQAAAALHSGKPEVVVEDFIAPWWAVPASGGSTEPPGPHICNVCGKLVDSDVPHPCKGIRTGGPTIEPDPEPSAPAPCCPACQAVREAAKFALQGDGTKTVMNTSRGLTGLLWTAGQIVEKVRTRLEEALAEPCAGRVGAPRKEEYEHAAQEVERASREGQLTASMSPTTTPENVAVQVCVALAHRLRCLK